MKLHELKIKHEYLVDITIEKKTFELRKNDRDYQIGDLIRFIDLEKNERIMRIEDQQTPFVIHTIPIDANALYRIIYILKDVPEYGLDKEYCILGIKRIKEVE